MQHTISSAPVLPIKSARDTRIGRILHDTGKLTTADIDRILHEQNGKKMRFGDAALMLGLVTESDVQKALARQFNYPYLPPEQHELADDLVAAYAPYGKQAEALRGLRSQLMMHWFGRGHKSLAIVSTEGQEGSSLLAANLAVVCSQLGEKTLLVDANLRDPQQDTLFRLAGRHGLADILADRADLGAIADLKSFPDLSVLQAGTRAPNPQELLGCRNFSNLARAFEKQFQIVLYDLPPLSRNADALTIAVRAEGALVVVRKHATSLPALGAAVQQLRDAGAEVAGSVMINF